MTVTVAQILRHPIKSLGREDLGAVTLHQGQTMPWDRTWAVAHEHSKADGTSWARCQNFLRVASSPALAAATSTLDEVSQTLTLRHPARPDLTVNPDADPGAIVDWVQPLVASTRSAAAQIMRVPGRGMTDSDYPSITLANLASHRAVEDQIGHPLSLHRWRCNLWLDGLDPWAEVSWIGKTLRVGSAELTVREPTTRCTNVLANPDTGLRDADVLAALDHFGHQDFSVLAEVTASGTVTSGDTVTLL